MRRDDRKTMLNLILLTICITAAAVCWHKYNKGYGFRFNLGKSISGKYSHYGYFFAPSSKATNFSRLLLLLIAIFTSIGSMILFIALISGGNINF